MLAPIADALRDSLAAAAAGGFLRTLPGRKRPVVYFAVQVRAGWQGEQGSGCGRVSRVQWMWGRLLYTQLQAHVSSRMALHGCILSSSAVLSTVFQVGQGDGSLSLPFST
jgi:hypothetical protein